jgi:hypothetical protein
VDPKVKIAAKKSNSHKKEIDNNFLAPPIKLSEDLGNIENEMMRVKEKMGDFLLKKFASSMAKDHCASDSEDLQLEIELNQIPRFSSQKSYSLVKVGI